MRARSRASTVAFSYFHTRATLFSCSWAAVATTMTKVKWVTTMSPGAVAAPAVVPMSIVRGGAWVAIGCRVVVGMVACGHQKRMPE
jgi:hypothetical protein